MLRCCLFLIFLLNASEGTHFRGVHIWWRPAGPTTVHIFYRIAWRRSWNDDNTFCDQSTINQGLLIGPMDDKGLLCRTGDCINKFIGHLQYRCTDFSTAQDWSSGSNQLTYNFAHPGYYEVSWIGRGWLKNLVQGGDTGWEVRAAINLTARSDTGTSNRSPSSAMAPIVRLQKGCNSTIRIPFQDPDGDVVRCRFAKSVKSECGGVCGAFVSASINQEQCMITFPWYGMAGIYAVTVQLEDFSTSDSKAPLSSVPLQFLVDVFDANKTCTSKPTWLHPTPPDGACYGLAVDETYRATLIARTRDIDTKIEEITTVSGQGMIKSDLKSHGSDSRDYSVDITWTPNINQTGQNIFCFTALDNLLVSSDQRCIKLAVGFSAPKPISVDVDYDMRQLNITFDKKIRGSRLKSDIRIYRQDGQLVQTSDASSTDISVSDRQMSVFVRANAWIRGSYYILFDEGVVKSMESCGVLSESVTGPTSLTYSLDSVATLSPSSTNPPIGSSSTKAATASVAPPTTPSGQCNKAYEDLFYVWFRGDICPTVALFNQPLRTWGVFSAVGPSRYFNGKDQEISIYYKNFTKMCYGQLDLCLDGITVTFWLRVPDDADRIILSSQGKIDTDRTLQVKQLQGSKLQATLFSGETIFRAVDNSGQLLIGEWNHIAITWLPSKDPRIYINGVACGCDVTVDNVKADRQVDTYRVARDAGEPGKFSVLNMQELRFYDQSYTPAAIQQLFRKGKAYVFTKDPIRAPFVPFPVPESYVYNGNPATVPGFIGMATEFSGNQHITLGDYANRCLGDPTYCQSGFTLSFWMNPYEGAKSQCPVSSGGDIPGDVGVSFCFDKIPNQSSIHVTATVSNTSKTWRVTARNIPIFEGAWNNVVLTWHPQQGLFVYLNGNPILFKFTSDDNGSGKPEGEMSLGRNTNGKKAFSGILDEVYFWEVFTPVSDANRLYTSSFHYQFPMDKISGTKLEADREATTINGPVITDKGLFDGALVLQPHEAARVNNDRTQCFGSLHLCPRGYSISTWLLILRSDCSRYIFSNGGQDAESHGIALVYEGSKGFTAYARTKTRLWTVTKNTSPPVESGIWYHIMLSWTMVDGLYLYVNESLLGWNSTGSPAPLLTSVNNVFYIGRANAGEVVSGCRTSIQLDNMKVWSIMKHPKEVAEAIPDVNSGNTGGKPNSEALTTNGEDLTWLIYVVIGMVILVVLLTIIGIVAKHRRLPVTDKTQLVSNQSYSQQQTATETIEYRNSTFEY